VKGLIGVASKAELEGVVQEAAKRGHSQIRVPQWSYGVVSFDTVSVEQCVCEDIDGTRKRWHRVLRQSGAGVA
jgi:hypothetical protein